MLEEIHKRISTEIPEGSMKEILRQFRMKTQEESLVKSLMEIQEESREKYVKESREGCSMDFQKKKILEESPTILS